MKYDVFGIGNPLVDLLIKVDDNALIEMNIDKGSMRLLTSEELNLVMDKIKRHEITIAPGDSTANTLAGIANMGGYVVYCGKVGNDDHGMYYQETLKKANIIHNLAIVKGVTGKAISFITPDSERTFAVHLGVCVQLKKEDILEEDIKQSRFLHLTGYQLEDPGLREMALHAMDIAKKHNVKISIDVADPNLIRRCLADLLDILKIYADVIFANEEEAKALTGLEPDAAAEAIAKYCNIAVVKIGKEGSIISAYGKKHRIKGYPAKAVDTTGAGDMFAAGFLYGLSKNMDIEKCGKIGSYAASLIVQKIGARLDKNIDVEELLKKI